MPTKLFSLMSAMLTGLTNKTAQLSARFTVTLEPSRVAMVAVLPSIAAILPRSRVGGLCPMATDMVAARASKAAAQTTSGRIDMGTSPPQVWHGGCATAAYDCVREMWPAAGWGDSGSGDAGSADGWAAAG